MKTIKYTFIINAVFFSLFFFSCSKKVEELKKELYIDKVDSIRVNLEKKKGKITDSINSIKQKFNEDSLIQKVNSISDQILKVEDNTSDGDSKK